MSDIVERLRRDAWNPEDDRTIAADTIEALRRERDSNKRQADSFFAQNGALNTKCVNLETQLAAMTQERDTLKEEYALCRKLLMDRTHDMTDARDKLAAEQAYSKQLREAVVAMADDGWLYHGPEGMSKAQEKCYAAYNLPHTDEALRQWGAKLLRDAAAHSTCFDKMQFFVSYLNRMADELEKKNEVD